MADEQETTASPDDGRPSILFTERARKQVLDFMAQDEADDLAVRMGVLSPSPLDPRYELALIEPDERTDDDRVVSGNGFDVVVAGDSLELLDGASVDWIETLTSTGFKVENPNIKPLGADLEGPLAERVQHVIDNQINPAVASHGGQIHLVDVRDRTAYVRMSGGCQGCGMASVTLTQGIRRMILEAIPEIEEIEDVTNHAAGSNPYYEQQRAAPGP